MCNNGIRQPRQEIDAGWMPDSVGDVWFGGVRVVSEGQGVGDVVNQDLSHLIRVFVVV